MSRLQRITKLIDWLVFSEIIKNRRDLAEKLGYKESSLSQILNNKVPASDRFIKKLSILTNKINEEWLLTGQGSMLIHESSANEGTPYWDLPVSAGLSVMEVIGKNTPDGFIKGLPGADIAENILPVVGVSMIPEVNPGAIIGVRKINNWETLNTERIYLIITQDDRMIKRIEHDPEDERILWCVSPNFPKFKIYKEEIIDIQRVCFVYNPK